MSGDPYGEDEDSPELETEDELSPAERLLARERFGQARFDVGYVRADVDALVEALRESYVETGSIDGVIEAYVLHTGGFREGYEISEFEDWLAELVQATDTQLGQRPDPVALAGSDPLSGGRSRRKRTESTGDQGSPSVITEHRGLLSRLRRH